MIKNIVKEMWDLFVLAIKWLFRAKILYKVTGFACITYIIVELNNVDIPTAAEPNYTKIGEKYGEPTKVLSGWLVDKFGGGINYIGIAIAFIILISCLLIEFGILKPQKIINAKNIFSGWFTINIQTNHYDKE
ncbi:hypothetical protein [Lacinutrix mariniflava]|uniref:hypothetical protein n=1 Tax=Lacinutrix mariniflava TaxID=342955 RepID=UPI0006E1343B|nr:hypothetical protein [Lacinutrix mariniflava]